MAFHLMDMGCGICTLILMVMDTWADPTDYGMQSAFRRTRARRTMSQTGHTDGVIFRKILSSERFAPPPCARLPHARAHGSERAEDIEMWIPAFAGM